MTIMNVLNQIAHDEIVLPAIQRDFVWGEEKVEKLLDSIMRRYPIGIALLWETYEDIQYRSFQKNHKRGQLFTFADNGRGRRLKLVLDGQQRLQSLFIALFGTREGRRVYFDVLSGRSGDDVAEERFLFHFLTPSEVRQRARAAREGVRPSLDEASDLEHLVPVGDLFSMSPREKKDLTRSVATKLDLSTEDELRCELNLAQFDEVLSKDQNILRVSTIDEDLPAKSPERQTEADVLEIFVRINREGTQLSRSDLIFSMLKLNWKESAEALPEFVRTINKGNSLDIDNDFVIRCLFVVSDLGSRLDLDILRKRSNVRSLQGNFARCCEAIRATVDFVTNECKCEGGAVLGGINTMVPFVYYFFHLPKHEVPNKDVEDVRRALYLFSFARPFSRYADSRIGAFVRNELRQRLGEGDYSWPLERSITLIRRWEKISSLAELAQQNESLTLHLVQGRTGASVQYNRNAPEVDHIFPRAQLRKKSVPEEEINHFANFWILAKGKNRNKSDRHPKDYFSDVSNRQLVQAIIDREMLDYRRFSTFLRDRADRMIDRLRKTLGLSDTDLAPDSESSS